MSGEDGLGDPKAAFAAERAAGLGPAVRVTSRAATRRRGGFRFTREPMVLGPDRLSPAAARQLLGDPELVVEIRDRDGGFVTLQGDDLSGHLAEVDAFLAAQPDMADAHADGLVSPGAKLGRDSTAPFGGGRTGSGFVDDGGSPAYRAAVTGEPQPVPGVHEAMTTDADRAELADAALRELDAADRGDSPVLTAGVDHTPVVPAPPVPAPAAPAPTTLPANASAKPKPAAKPKPTTK